MFHGSAHEIRNPCFSLLLATTLIVISSISVAHTPHDTIDALAIDNSKQNDSTLFVVRGGRHLMRSHDGGASWKELVNGIDARYSITSVALASYADGTATKLYMTTDGDGVYVSHNAGTAWSKANAGLDALRIQNVAVVSDDENSTLVFAATATGSLYRKTAGAQAWQRVFDDDAKITAFASHKHKGVSRLLVGDESGNLQVSIDGGDSWSKLASVHDVGVINSITLFEKDDDDKPLIFLGTEKRGVLRSVNGGSSFEEADDWSFDKHVTSVAISPKFNSDTTVYASTWHEALLKSEDSGKTWAKFDQGLSTHPQADLPAFYSPSFRQISIDETDGAIYMAGFDGLFKSNDSGRNWVQIETEPVGNIWALSLSPAANNDFVVAATTFNAGAYMAPNSSLDWSINNRGLISTRLRKLVFSPNFASDKIVFSSEDEGDNLLRSTDGGKNWNAVNLRPNWYVYWKRKILGALRQRGVPASLTTDLITKEERIRANPKGLVVSPGFDVDRYLYIATRYRGNFESTDAGQSLDIAKQAPFKVWNLAMSPGFASDKILFASSRERGIYKSIDAGSTWLPVSNGLDFLSLWQKQVNEDKAHMAAELGRSKYYDILLAISPNYKRDKTLFAAGGEGVFKSIDGGDTWLQKGQRSLAGEYVFAIALSPNYEFDKTVVVSVKGKGLFSSGDGGETFSTLNNSLIKNNHEMRHIDFSPLYVTDNTLYAVSLEDVFRSTDGGASWQLIERPIRYENDKYDVIVYEGEWDKIRNPEFSARWAARSRSKDSSVSLSFVGTGIKWIGAKSPDLGQAEVYLDGKRLADVSQHSQSQLKSAVNYSIKDLPYKRHTLTITVSANSGGNSILIDAFDVIGNRRPNR